MTKSARGEKPGVRGEGMEQLSVQLEGIGTALGPPARGERVGRAETSGRRRAGMTEKNILAVAVVVEVEVEVVVVVVVRGSDQG